MLAAIFSVGVEPNWVAAPIRIDATTALIEVLGTQTRHPARDGTAMHQFALFAGSTAAAIFMISQLPMLIKARRTKNLTSYSFTNIGLANFGNVLYAVYVFQVPVGPVWATHAFNLTTSGLILFWYLRYGCRPRALVRGAAVSELEESSGVPWSANGQPAGT